MTKSPHDYTKDVKNARSLKELEKLRLLFLGRKGKINQLLKKIPELPANQRKSAGREVNKLKGEIEKALKKQESKLKKGLTTMSGDEWMDVTMPGQPARQGQLHPTTIVINEINKIFERIGFSVVEGPEIETDKYNFERTNLPHDHPARDLWDTLYLKYPEILLRTHTSSVEARVLEKYRPPIRAVIPGICYRAETPNPSNNAVFFQYQGVVVDRAVKMSHLKWILNYFIEEFFGAQTKSRFRNKYYPEVEPGVGVDIECVFCQRKGCSVCKSRGFVEMLGAGMHHPQMLEMAGIDHRRYSGFHWGMGLDRIVMARFGIDDIRSLYNGDIT